MDTKLDIKKHATNSDFYWGVSTKEEISNFIELSRKEGFFNAIKEDKFDVFKKYALPDDRANFIDYLPINKNSSVLDLGSGYGNITIPIAKKVREVYACDGTFELLEFSRERAIAENISNIHFIHIDPVDYCNTPFKKGMFDVIILNGVFEWIGTEDTSKSPREIQLKVLEYLSSLLKDDGFIYIGIENRWWPMYLWNTPDPHSKKMYTAILPRFLSDLVMRFYGQKNGYRNYIYSFWGYKKLFKSANFEIKNLFFPLKSYRNPKYMLNSKDREGLRDLVNNKFHNIFHWKVVLMLGFFYHLGLFKYVTHSYGFMLTKYK